MIAELFGSLACQSQAMHISNSNAGHTRANGRRLPWLVHLVFQRSKTTIATPTDPRGNGHRPACFARFPLSAHLKKKLMGGYQSQFYRPLAWRGRNSDTGGGQSDHRWNSGRPSTLGGLVPCVGFHFESGTHLSAFSLRLGGFTLMTGPTKDLGKNSARLPSID